GARVERVGARLDQRGERDSCDRGRFRRSPERLRRVREPAADALHVAAALEIRFRGGVRVTAALEGGGGQKLGFGFECGGPRGFRLGEERVAKILLGDSLRREQQREDRDQKDSHVNYVTDTRRSA